MSQVLVHKQNHRENLLFQDLYFKHKSISVKTGVSEAVCDICKKGLEDNLSVTAFKMERKVRLYCSNHFPQ